MQVLIQAGGNHALLVHTIQSLDVLAKVIVFNATKGFSVRERLVKTYQENALKVRTFA